ncbi:MAG: hypothetical protein PVI30_06205 [Myxococcales bacterium]|jgi:hypothetical protein
MARKRKRKARKKVGEGAGSTSGEPQLQRATTAEPSDAAAPADPPEPAAVIGSGAGTPAPRRRWENAFIAVFIVGSVLAPLHYYLSDRVSDERFAWRMFSSVRMRRCDIRVEESRDDRSYDRVDLREQLHVAWSRIMERGRPAVVHKYLHRRCEASGAETVRYRYRCRETDGTETPEVQVTLQCEDGEPVHEGGPL